MKVGLRSEPDTAIKLIAQQPLRTGQYGKHQTANTDS
jgi:hypothetical protein